MIKKLKKFVQAQPIKETELRGKLYDTTKEELQEEIKNIQKLLISQDDISMMDLNDIYNPNTR